MPWKCFMVDGYTDPRSEMVGAMWPHREQDGRTGYFVRVPGGRLAHVTPRIWSITGDPPKLTVRNSISVSDSRRHYYHGWITDGWLSDDVDGRAFAVEEVKS